MYAGHIVETGPVERVMKTPLHPYTEGLLASTVHGAMRGRRLQAIRGSPPNMEAISDACSFAPRCPYAEDKCERGVPAERWAEIRTHGTLRAPRRDYIPGPLNTVFAHRPAHPRRMRAIAAGGD